MLGNTNKSSEDNSDSVHGFKLNQASRLESQNKKKQATGKEAVLSEKRRSTIMISGLAILLVGGFLFSFIIGRYEGIPFHDVVLALLDKFTPLSFDVDESVYKVVNFIRFPRIFAGMLVGAMLALAGASYQSVFRNPLVSPDILGASAGASMGAALAIFNGQSGLMIQVAAFVCSVGTILCTYAVASRVKRDQVLALILSGMVISALASAVVSLLKFVADPNDKLPAITYWLLGSLSNITYDDVLRVFPFMLVGTVVLFSLRWKLNILSLGDDEAKALGIGTKSLRRIIIICSTLITAASISIAGLVGWVGLVIPHFCRLLVGANNRYLIPASILFGGFFLIVVDDVARSLLAVEIPLGVLTAIIGAPIFIAMIMRKETW